MQDITIYDIDLKSKFNQYYYSNISYILFKLQKKIYGASKQCHLSLVHGLQKLLISLSSIKFLAKNKVYQTILRNNILKQEYKIKQTNKQLFDKILKEEINKQIIYWILESEWKAKVEVNSFFHKYQLERIKLLQNILYNQQIFYLKFNQIIYPKHIRIEYLITKLQSFKWINQQISNILKIEYCIHHFNTLNKNNCNINLLFELLSEILHIGLRWAITRQIKANVNSYLLCCELLTAQVEILYFAQNIQNLYEIKLIAQSFLKNINFYIKKTKIYYVTKIDNYINFKHISFNCKSIGLIKYLRIKPNIEIIKQLIKLIKNSIYHKDKFGRTRANTNISLKAVIYKLNTTFKMWQQNFSEIIQKSYLFNIASIIDEIIYRWMKKKYSNNNDNKFAYKIFNQ